MEDESMDTMNEPKQNDGDALCATCNHASHKREPCAECGCEDDM